MMRRPPISTLFPCTPLFRSQYGPHAAAIAVYLCLGQHLPVERTASLLAELFGTPMSVGTVAAWTSRAAAGLAPFTAAVRAGLDRKSTRLNSSHANISYAVFC